MRVYVAVVGNQLWHNKQGVPVENVLVEELHKQLVEHGVNSVELELIAPAEISKPGLKVHRLPNQGKNAWARFLLDTLRSFFAFSRTVEPTNQDANQIVSALFKNAPHDRTTVLVLAGSFPTCYDTAARRMLLAELRAMPPRDKQTIYTALAGGRRGPELDVIDSLPALLGVIAKPLNVPQLSHAPCEQEVQNIYGMFFEPVPQRNFAALIDYIHRTIGKQIRLTVWNDGPAHGSVMLWMSPADSVAFRRGLDTLARAKWSSINFLFTHCLNTLRKDTSKGAQIVLMVGHFPTWQNMRVLPPEFWKELRSLANVQYVHILPAQDPTEIDREYVSVLRKYKGLSVITNY